MSNKYPGGLILSGANAGYSVAFDGTGDYLTLADNAAFAFGTGDFTIELFAYRTNSPSGTQMLTAQSDNSTGAGSSYGFYLNTNTIEFFACSGSTFYSLSSAGFTTATWTHLAAVRTGTTLSLFVNGSRVATTSIGTASVNDVSQTLAIGSRNNGTDAFTGNISNLRIIKGSGPYNATLTSLATPTQLLNVTNTSLLTCNSPAIVDQSSNAFTITANGNAAVSTFTPFQGYVAYNPALGAATPGIWTVSDAIQAAQTRRWNMYDPYFNLTTLLLHGNGTNGAQNNTFLDSSSNNFTITRNGNTTQGTFSPFSQTGWGNYFNGSSYLNVGTTRFLDVSAWTVEMWVNTTSTTNAVTLAAQYVASGGGFAQRTVLGINNSSGTVYIFQGGTAQNGTTNVADGRWHHIAFVLNAGTVRAYVDGINEATFSGFGSPTAVTTTFFYDSANASSYFLGYASNLRVTNTAVYTANFTVATSPLTAITGTQLLTCQSNRFIDNSANAYTITVNGSPSVQAFSPFYPLVAYTPQAQGGSGYFDGTGDYLSSTISAISGTFTIEFWFYRPSSGSNFCFTIGDSQTGGNTSAEVYIGTSGTVLNYWTNNNAQITGTPAAAGQWVYLAVTRDGSNVVRLYQNGTQVGGTYTQSGTLSTALRIGVEWYGGVSTGTTNGYIGHFRVSNSVRTVTTVPTAPFTSDANTVFLANFTNAGIIDSTGDNVLETVGNAQISTTQSKFGGSSMSFDGTANCRVQVSSSAAPPIQNIGTGDYTVELWVRVSSFAAQQMVFDYRTGDTTGQGVGLYINTSGQAIVFYSSANRITSSALSTNTWTHIALVRSSGTYTLYIGGTSAGTWANSDAVAPPANRPYIGEAGNGGQNFNGYIDDFRITRYARYTGNFTPQTSQWQDQ